MPRTASPGHKLGQMVGDFVEDLFAPGLEELAHDMGLFFDRKGSRPARESSVLVEWRDSRENRHRLDYVLEREGSPEQIGRPVAFIELAWRRYTKHSINKASEIEGALLHLKESYPSCQFVGAILAGEYTEGAKAQLSSRGIMVLHVPFPVVSEAFGQSGVVLTYPENAPAAQKRKAIRKWDSLTNAHLREIGQVILAAVSDDYETFVSSLRRAVCAIERIRVTPLFGRSYTFGSVAKAIAMLRGYDETPGKRVDIVRYEIEVRYANGESLCRVVFSRERALEYLEQLQ